MNYLIKTLFIVCIFSQTFGQEAKNRYALPLRHLDAQHVADVLNAALQITESDHIVISAEQLEANNNLIIIASHDDYAQIKELIEQLDIPLQDVEVDLKTLR